MLRLLVLNTKARDNHLDVENSDSEMENVFPANTFTPVKNKTTIRKNTPTVSRNKIITWNLISFMFCFVPKSKNHNIFEFLASTRSN